MRAGAALVGPGPLQNQTGDTDEDVPCTYCDPPERGAVLAVQDADGDEERAACASHLIAFMDAVLRPKVEATDEEDEEPYREELPWGE